MPNSHLQPSTGLPVLALASLALSACQRDDCTVIKQAAKYNDRLGVAFSSAAELAKNTDLAVQYVERLITQNDQTTRLSTRVQMALDMGEKVLTDKTMPLGTSNTFWQYYFEATLAAKVLFGAQAVTTGTDPNAIDFANFTSIRSFQYALLRGLKSASDYEQSNLSELCDDNSQTTVGAAEVIFNKSKILLQRIETAENFWNLFASACNVINFCDYKDCSFSSWQELCNEIDMCTDEHRKCNLPNVAALLLTACALCAGKDDLGQATTNLNDHQKQQQILSRAVISLRAIVAINQLSCTTEQNVARLTGLAAFGGRMPESLSQNLANLNWLAIRVRQKECQAK